MNIADIARVVLAEALAAHVRERVALTVAPHRVEVVVYDPERERPGGKVIESNWRIHDHTIQVEVVRGVVRLVYPDLAHVTKTRPIVQFESVAG